MNNKVKNTVICITFGIFIFTFALLCLFLPKDEYSVSERRPLEKFPEVTAESIFSGKFMSDFEKYSVDSFPFRDSFRTIKAISALGIFRRGDNNGIYLHDGYISKVEYPISESSLDRAASRFKYVTEKYLDGTNKVYYSIINDKNAFMAEESGHLAFDYEAFEKEFSDRMDFAEYIKISDLLSLEDFYRTDTHWRQEAITDIAERLCSAMGTSAGSDFTENTLDVTFNGVYTGQAALPIEGDTIRYLTNGTIEKLRVFDHQNGIDSYVYDMEKAKGKDPYEMFLAGPLSLVTVENPENEDGGHLIMFRDSFSSSLAPLMAEGYSKITLIDIRYISPDILSKFVDFKNADVLFIYSTMVLNSSDTIK
ncbi:MAG: hypothetical protein E7660_04800 [Ruminococcaceae bacterium]|nr:hypothetical protein [Oscillospiraceae bacterium]